MALKVTDTIQTSGGATSEIYFHITEYYRDKSGKNSNFPVQYWMSQASYNNGDEPVQIFVKDLQFNFKVDLSEVIGTDKMEKLVYDKIASKLKTAGLSVWGDASGDWVQY